jgi:hypothetical protein
MAPPCLFCFYFVPPARTAWRLTGNGTVNTGQPAVLTIFSAVLPKKILSTFPTDPP